QGQIGLLNRGSDRRVTPVLRPGTAPGSVQLELKVEDKLPLHGNVELNDRYSANTSHLRLSGMLRYDNLWQRDHSLTITAQTSPQNYNQVRVYSGSYLMPLVKDNLLALYAIDSESNVAAIGTLGVIGKGRIYGTRAIVPLQGTGSYYHNLTLG